VGEVPRLDAPIFMLHGVLGFASLAVAGVSVWTYYRGIVDLFRAAGNTVYTPWLPPTASIAERAARLAEFIEERVPGRPVHLIGHSMGGLDARYLASRLLPAGRVLTVTTIGTPHAGSPVADVIDAVAGFGLRWAGDLLGIPAGALADLTRAGTGRFDRAAPDRPGVRYFAAAGDYGYDGGALKTLWKPHSALLHHFEGPNDGIVSVRSAMRPGYESLGVWHGDHMGLINWPAPLGWVLPLGHDRRIDYAALLRRLAAAGF
jgi:triacylglycerol lipase